MEPPVPSYQGKKRPPPLREIPEGGVLKATLRGGRNDGARPQEGQQVIVHNVTRRSSDPSAVLESTRKELGGSGVPHRFLLGKQRCLWAWEYALPSMRVGEVAVLKVQPAYAYGDPQSPWERPEHVPADEELLFELELLECVHVKELTEDGSVVKQVLEEGDGWENPRPPYEVTVQVEAAVSGSSEPFFQPSGPLEFALGTAKVPPGVEVVLQSMLVHEKARCWLRGAHQLHLRDGLLAPPPDAEEVTASLHLRAMNQVRDVMGDGLVIKRRLVPGRGEFPMDCPLEDSTLHVHVRGTLADGAVFWDTRNSVGGGDAAPLPALPGQPLEFATGEGLVPEGLESSLRLMLLGEEAIIHCAPKYAYDAFPRPAGVPAAAAVVWEAVLVSFAKVRSWVDLDSDAVLAEMDSMRVAGNRLFKQGKYSYAQAKYDRVLRQLKRLQMGAMQEQAAVIQRQTTALRLNLAATHIKLTNYAEAVRVTTEVLQEDPGNAKALFRRAQAYLEWGDLGEAEADFQAMAQADPAAETDAKTGLAKVRRRKQEHRVQAKQQWGGMLRKRPGALSEALEKSSRTEEPDHALQGQGKADKEAWLEGSSCSDPNQVVKVAREGLDRAEQRTLWPIIVKDIILEYCTIL